MKKLILVLITLVLVTFQVEAALLSIVNVNAPAINCVYNPPCTVTVSDSSGTITLGGTSGSGFLQSRTFMGQAGSPAAGLYAYEYRIDLRNLVGITFMPAITSMTIDFGPVVNTLDYNKDGKPGEQVFVITTGGLGTVAPVTANKIGSKITFTFNPAVAGGSAPGSGQSSYFFGMTSIKPPKPVIARLRTSTGAILNIPARAPNF